MNPLSLFIFCNAVFIIAVVALVILLLLIFQPALFVGLVVGGFAGLLAGLAVESMLHMPAVSIAVGVVVCGIFGKKVADAYGG